MRSLQSASGAKWEEEAVREAVAKAVAIRMTGDGAVQSRPGSRHSASGDRVVRRPPLA